jgi:RNA-binding protein Nova
MSNPPSDMGKVLQQISTAQAKTSKDHLQDYFKSDVSVHEVSFAMSTKPEGSAIKGGSLTMSNKAVHDEPSSKSEKGGSGSPPPNPSAATTGTTSTPTSVGGNSEATVISTSTGPVATSPEPSVPSDGFHPTVETSERRDNRTAQQTWSTNFESPVNPSKYTTTPPSQSTPAPDGALTNSPSLGSMSGRYNVAAFPCAIKLLVSNNVAGYIIGRSGQTVSELQAQSSTRIKLSQTGDYFPGTQDRVCLVQGQIENVKMAMRMLLERLFMLQEQQTSQGYAWQPRPPESGAAAPFEFVVRLLVPASSCGMIIGKSGSNIKHMEEATGVASVRLSPKEGIITDPSYPPTAAAAAVIAATSERVVTLSGPSLESCVQCTFIIVDGMTLHPEICRYTNMTTSYSRVLPTAAAAGGSPFGTGLGTNPLARGPLLAIPNTARMQSVPAEGSSLWDPQQQNNHPPPLEKRVSSSPDLAAPHPFLEGTIMSPISPHFAQSFESGGVPNSMTYSPREAAAPFHHPQISPSPSSPSPLMYLMGGMPPSSSSASEPPRLPGCSSAPDLIAMGHQDSFATFEDNFNYLQPPTNTTTTMPPSHASASHVNFAGTISPGLPHHHHHHAQQQPPSPNHPGAVASAQGIVGGSGPGSGHNNSPAGGGGFMGQVLVPDAFIGLILGRGGRTLHELQVQSGTRIRISQRGEYVPGSRDRIVTIKGPTAQSIHVAQVLIHQRMAVLPLSQTTASIMRNSNNTHHHHHHNNAGGYGSSGTGMMVASMGMPPNSPAPPSDRAVDMGQAPPQSSQSQQQQQQQPQQSHSSSSSS